MIGAEIVLLVVLLAGGATAITSMVLGSRRKDREHRAMRADMRAALLKHDYIAVDAFLAMWGPSLGKDEREAMDKIRNDLFLSNEKVQ